MENGPAYKQVEDIVKRAQAGDQAAFAELYEMYYDPIYRYISFRCGNQTEAEDLSGEVFVKMIESVRTFKFRGFPFSSWLYKIAHNVVVDNFRRKGRRPTVPLDNAVNTTSDAHSDLERMAEVSLTIKEVVGAMENLTELQREVVTLRFAAGLTIAETAKAVGRKENAVKALQHAGIRKLRDALAPPGGVRPSPAAGTKL